MGLEKVRLVGRSCEATGELLDNILTVEYFPNCIYGSTNDNVSFTLPCYVHTISKLILQKIWVVLLS